MTHICACNLTIFGSDNGLSPGRRQAIIWTNAGLFSIRNLGTNFSEIVSEIHKIPFKKMHLKMSSGYWRPFCLGLDVLTQVGLSYLPPGGRFGILSHCSPEVILTITPILFYGMKSSQIIWSAVTLFMFNAMLCGIVKDKSTFVCWEMVWCLRDDGPLSKPKTI